ncbi:hypothetical protein ITP53_23420 [Nonomuraea sp. K274]|uniref:Uncharacterized protein n=1 Tax=Nonomuraea cypriaca TaxID=1187855 RepID=A0A931AB54_9ACTN|nr:hypothetical protein [Nonomuraea cypriaca]MBF8188623.1 hypothetical protein [Nonomuraea cypriaca]
MSEAPGAPGPTPADAPKEMRSSQHASVTINGPVSMGPSSAIGIADAMTGHVTRRREGRVPPRVVDDSCRRYARPDRYTEALDTLRDESPVIVLYGPDGHGKRTGALNLLRDLGGERRMVMLLPDLTELAGRDDYQKDTAYLVFDCPGEDAERGDSDVSLGALAGKIEATEGTHLVITSEREVSKLVPHFRWERPSPESILAAHEVGEAGVEPALLHEHSLADIVLFARNLASGMDPDKSLDGLDLALRRKVEEWFEGRPEPRDLLEAAALVFLDGLPEGVFEPLRDQLAAAVIPPPPDTEEPARPEALEPIRKRGERSLVTTPRRAVENGDAIPGQTQRCVEFKSEGYRTHVIAEFCNLYPQTFWEHLFEWLNEIVDDPDPEVRIRVSQGLALLAEYDFDGVRTHVLQPWSCGEHGWRAWTAARDVLSFMCMIDTAAPLARRTAIRWSRSKDELRRCAAAFAFSGGVGVLYPHDALRHLWLLWQQPETADSAATAIALLYLTLNDAGTGDDQVVLEELIARLRRFARGNMDTFQRTVDIAMDVLRIRYGERHVAAEHLAAREAAPLFGELLALLAVYRPRRTDAFSLIFDLLEVLDKEPEAAPGPLIAALKAALPLRERTPFASQFVLYATRRGAGHAPPFASLVTSIFQQECQ